VTVKGEGGETEREREREREAEAVSENFSLINTIKLAA
jgi:hypothetical protein